MNNILLIIISIYFIISFYFFLKFYKNNYNLPETITAIKIDIKKIFKCCIDKKNIRDKFSSEKADELEKEMDKLKEEDCKEPYGVPLDICLEGNLTKEEILIREKVLKIINKKDMKVFHGGKNKLVLPMESVLFLTKNLNPLVSEEGNITITMSSEFMSQRNQNSEIPPEELEKLIIQLKDKDSILYKDDEELVNSINFLIKHKKFNIETPVENVMYQKEETIEEYIPKNISKETNEITIEKLDGPDEDIYIKKEIEEEYIPKISINATPFDSEPEIDDFSSVEDSSDLDLNDLLMQELENIDLDDDNEIVSSKEKEKSDFYKEIDFKSVKNIVIDFENLEHSISSIFSKEESFYALFRNMAKANPIIFNGNKTVCLIDQNIILFAISKMFGMDSKTYLEQFQKLNKDSLKTINKVLEEKLDIYLSDLLSGTKKGNFYLVKDKNGHLYYTFAFVFQTNAFKTSFTSEKFDYFRSFPYNASYEFVKKASVEETKEASKLIIDIKDVENK